MSFRLAVKIATLASTFCMSIGAALAENRIALVIGNANYAAVTPLSNPANDAKAMAQFLGGAGFQVLRASDLTQGAMLRTIGKFADRVAASGPDTVALVFYAGHGLQVDGENYLVPVDAAIQREADVPLQAMRLADLMTALSAVPTKALIVMLDACRNNPFAEIRKSGGRGLAMVDAPTGSLISYATAPGTEAMDGDGDNSPYTAAVLKVGREEGLPIEQALKRVRLAVNAATDRQQVPWESSSLTGEFSFFPGERGTAGSTQVAGLPAAAARSQSRSVASWQKEFTQLNPGAAYDIVIREDKVEAYEAYLLVFPSDPLAGVVRRIFERRREMIAWNDAVRVNTTESYQGFLARHGGSDYAATAQRLKERPRQKRTALAPAPANGRAVTAPDTVVVEPPVVAPVYDPPRFQFHPRWRYRHPPHAKPGWPKRPPHDGKPARIGGHDKRGKVAKFAKPARLAKPTAPTRLKARGPARNVVGTRRMTINRTMTFNRATSMGNRSMMMGRGMSGMSMGFRSSFGRMGSMGGRR
jgi:Caspase domain